MAERKRRHLSYVVTLRGFRCEMHSASKYGGLFELEERVGTGVFTNQTCAANRNRSKSFIVE